MAFAFWLQTLYLIDFSNLFQLNGSEAIKQRPHKLLWTLLFDEKVYLMVVYVIQKF